MLGIWKGYEGYLNAQPLPNSIKAPTGEYIDGNSAQAKSLKRVGQAKCETCAERKYQDGSDENVSFKAAAHISPESAGARVRAHEQEHVANAYSEAAKKNGKVIQASVRISTAICPECGRSYVSGGLTSTTIKYDESTAYGKNQKSFQAEAAKGNNIDAEV